MGPGRRAGRATDVDEQERTRCGASFHTDRYTRSKRLTIALAQACGRQPTAPTACRTGLGIPTFELYLSLLFIVQSSIKIAN
jgi:hypothetical protein